MVAKKMFGRCAFTAVTRLSAVLLVAAGTSRGQWIATEEAKLLSIDVDQGDFFGWSVAVSGDTAVIGAYEDDHSGLFDAGSVYVFVRNGTNWIEEAKLTASDAETLDQFGWSVAIDDDTVVVGALYADAGSDDAGAAYVFERQGTLWSQQQKLTASDAASGDFFGYSVALSGDTIITGASRDDHTVGQNVGSAYVFVRSAGNWSEQQKLVASDPGIGDTFGNSVAIEGDTAIIGALNGGAIGEGAAYVFVRSGSTWSEQQELVPSDGEQSDYFGSSVGLSEGTAVVGASYQHLSQEMRTGAAYVFVRSGAAWSEQQKLTASDPGHEDYFGGSVAILGDAVVVGAFSDDNANGPDAGSAYLYVRQGSIWNQEQKIRASDGDDQDAFGTALALSGGTLVIGAPFDEVEDHHLNNPYAGSAYVFRLWPPPTTYCTAGTSASGCKAMLSASGTASATAPSGFTLSAATVEGQKDGLFFFGTNGQQANPWGNGTSYQCVIPPVVRTPTMAGVGTIGLCDGSFALDLNALWCPSCPKPAKNPGPGTTVQAQLWYRDPLSTSNQTTSLSDAIEFGVGL